MSVQISNRLSHGLFISQNLLIVIFAIVYIAKFDKIDSSSNYGELLAGTKLDNADKSRWILLYPALFFGRRIALVLSVLLLRSILWA